MLMFLVKVKGNINDIVQATATVAGFKITISKCAQIYQLFSKTKILTGYFIGID